jgi:hypothetical protein
MSKRRKVRQQEEAKKKKRNNLVLLATATLAAALVIFYILTRPTSIEAGDGALATPVSVHDFGPVPVSRGTVSTELPLANIGEDDLVISFLDSSCGCTTAQVINGDEKGPLFGMSSHGKSPRDWRTVIKPGEKAALKIYYDPAVHPNFRGPGTRVVTITTNGRSTPEKQIRIKVMQID